MPHTQKKTILHALEINDFEAVASLAAGDRKVLSQLVRIAYDKETLIGWRAIEAVGLVARLLVKSDHEFLRDHCRKLLWSLSDESGGIGWSAPEMLGEIVSADPHRFADLLPLITQVYDIEEDVFRAGVLHALSRIAESAPELVAPYQDIISKSLDDKNPLVKLRGIALIRLLWPLAKSSRVWSPEYCEWIRATVAKLMADRGEAWAYKGNGFISIQVSEEAKEALKEFYNQ